MQQEARNGDDIMIEMSLKDFRTMHEPRSTNSAIGQTPTLNLPPLPQIHQTNAEATPALPAVSRSRERRSNTVISQVQGAFNLKMEDMASGGINREKFKSLIDNHLKRQKGRYNSARLDDVINSLLIIRLRDFFEPHFRRSVQRQTLAFLGRA